GVGLVRDLGVGPDAEPAADRVEQPRDVVGREQARRAAAEVHGVERQTGDRPRGSEGLVEGVRPQLELRRDRGLKRRDPVRRPAGGRAREHHEAAVRTERYAERDVDVQPDRRPRTNIGHRSDVLAERDGRAHRSRDAGSRGPMTRQPCGGRRFASISSTSRPRGRNWPAWPVETNTANRVTAWPRNAAAIPPVTAVTQPPASPIRTAITSSQRLRPGAPSRVARAYRSAWITFAAVGFRPVRRRIPRTAPRKATSSMIAVT